MSLASIIDAGTLNKGEIAPDSVRLLGQLRCFNFSLCWRMLPPSSVEPCRDVLSSATCQSYNSSCYTSIDVLRLLNYRNKISSIVGLFGDHHAPFWAWRPALGSGVSKPSHLCHWIFCVLRPQSCSLSDLTHQYGWGVQNRRRGFRWLRQK